MVFATDILLLYVADKLRGQLRYEGKEEDAAIAPHQSIFIVLYRDFARHRHIPSFDLPSNGSGISLRCAWLTCIVYSWRQLSD